jgi:SAM-dependent methyltransferase
MAAIPTQRLRELYEKTSKHSNYQVLPSLLEPYFTDNTLKVKSRHERERLSFILAHLNVTGKSVMDIGGNTGYFTFELLQAGANEVTYCEGNVAHAEFVREAGQLLGLGNRLDIRNEYFDFAEGNTVPYSDICLLLNVLHHVGDDYGDSRLSIAKAREEICRSLRAMTRHTSTLVFQLGFCWKGDRARGLFRDGTKQELIEFVSASVAGYWEIALIAVPEEIDGKVAYAPLSPSNQGRRDDLGEFLNRPLFILNKA